MITDQTTTARPATTTGPSAPAVGEGSNHELAATGQVGAATRLRARTRRLAERGMATAEYAVGILAAVALALVVLKVFTDNSFFSLLLGFVSDLIGKAGAMIPR